MEVHEKQCEKPRSAQLFVGTRIFPDRRNSQALLSSQKNWSFLAVRNSFLHFIADISLLHFYHLSLSHKAHSVTQPPKIAGVFNEEAQN